MVSVLVFFIFCNQKIVKKFCQKKKKKREKKSKKTLKKINKINIKEKRQTRQHTYINAMRMNK